MSTYNTPIPGYTTKWDTTCRADFLTNPLLYPGKPVTEPTLLTTHGPHPITHHPGQHHIGDSTVNSCRECPTNGKIPLNDYLTAANLPTVENRHPIVSTGSNSSAGIMIDKLSDRGHNPTFPITPAHVTGLSIGHSAHVSKLGYVAATPYPDKNAVSPVCVSWLTPEQMEAVDETELTYNRVTLSSTHYPLTMPHGETLTEYSIYVSTHGVIHTPAGQPLPFITNQTDLYHMLRQWRVFPWSEHDDWRVALAALNGDEKQREHAKQALRVGGYTKPVQFEGSHSEPRLYRDIINS